MRVVDCGVRLRRCKGLVDLGCQGCCQYLEPSEGAAGASEGKAPGPRPRSLRRWGAAVARAHRLGTAAGCGWVVDHTRQVDLAQIRRFSPRSVQTSQLHLAQPVAYIVPSVQVYYSRHYA